MILKPVYSYSQLNTFHTCPYAWQRLYLDKVQKDTNAFASYGTFIHELLQQCAEGKLPQDSLGWMFECEFDEKVPEQFPRYGKSDLRSGYFQQGVDFFEHFEGFDGIDILGTEEYFEIDRGDYVLHGYIDLIYRDRNNRLICRDWKSAKHYSKKKLKESAIQLYLYSAHCMERFGEYPAQLEFFHFREGNVKSVVSFDESEYRAALRWADDRVKEIRESWFYDYHYDYNFCNNLCSCRNSCEYLLQEKMDYMRSRYEE